ncbi:MAG: glycosyltransferase family 4 protein [Gemmatimonadetes bacterium]|nr:glycosyltransferase family 4 protein [Gemmatimonadota bacterium]
MRIAMISTPFIAVPPRDYGGTELVVHELVEGLAARGHEVTLFATGDSRTAAELRHLYPTAQWPPSIMPDLNHVSWAFEQIGREGYDVIHAHSAGALAFARLLPDTTLVYTLHHVRDEDLSGFYRFFPDPWYIAISADQAGREEPLPRLEVIHHGLDPSPYECTEHPADYVCFIGRFSEIKGPHTAIDGAASAGVPIRMAGEVHPVDREFGDREVQPRLRQPHVTYLGTIGMDQKVPLLRDARALLAPIEWNEPFGLILIEAMLSGCPVVAFPHGSVPELVEPGVTGFIARDSGEMAELIRPGGALESFDRRRCRERAVERFSRARMVADHERLYRRALGTGAGRRESTRPMIDGIPPRGSGGTSPAER